MMSKELSQYSLYDKIVDIIVYKENGTIALYIESDNTGLKPGVTIQAEAVAGCSVTACVVTIQGLQASTLSMRDWAVVEITAGYRGLGTKHNRNTLKVNIYSAWNVAPNPDGIVKIQGIVTGSALGMFFKPVQYNLNIRTSQITMEQLLNATLNNEGIIQVPSFKKNIQEGFLDTYIEVGDGVEARVGDIPIVLGSGTREFASGYSLVQWLSSVITEWGRGLKHIMSLNIFNDDVVISCFLNNKDPKKDIPAELCTELTLADNITFDSAILYVKGPWIPNITPGSLFYMNTKSFSLNNVFRRVDPYSAYIDSSNLYRAVIVNIVFSTITNENEMTISALPLRNAANTWDDIQELKNEGLIINESTLNDYVEKLKNNDVTNGIVTIEIENAELESMGDIKKGSAWSNVVQMATPSIKEKEIPLDFTTEIERIRNPKIRGYVGEAGITETAFTFANWYSLWWDKTLRNTSEAANYSVYPILKKSEMEKIRKGIINADLPASDSLMNELLNNTSYHLRPETLWITWVAYAFKRSYEKNDWLYKALDKESIGQVLTSVINMPLTDKANASLLNRKRHSLKASDPSTIKNNEDLITLVYTTPVNDLNQYRERVTVSIPDFGKPRGVLISQGGQRNYYKDNYGKFKDVIYALLSDDSLIKASKEGVLRDFGFDLNKLIVWYCFFNLNI